MVDVFVEGGGKQLGLCCRKAFSLFLKNAGMQCKFKVFPYGNRSKAYDDFKDAVKAAKLRYQ